MFPQKLPSRTILHPARSRVHLSDAAQKEMAEKALSRYTVRLVIA